MKILPFAALSLPLLLLNPVIHAQPPEPRQPEPMAEVAPLPPEEEVAHAVREFANAVFTDGGMVSAARYVQGAQTGAVLEKVGAEFKKARGTWKASAQNIEAQIEGDIASVKVRLRLSDSLFNRITHDERLTLRRANNWWMIVPLTSEQLRRNRHTNFDTDILLNLATYLAIPQEIIEASAHECMMNQKMLALGAMQFAQDWDDKFTFKADKYPEALRPYLRNDQILHCPDDRSGALSYTFNKNLENLLLARIAQPAQTVMFYEGKNGQLEFRHDNRASVCFADGHVELVTPERAKTLKWTP